VMGATYERCTKCGRERPDTIADPTCGGGGYCDWKVAGVRKIEGRPIAILETDLRELLDELRHLRQQVTDLQVRDSQLVLERQRETAVLAHLRAVEVLAQEAYRQAMRTNGRVTMGTWALLGDVLEPVSEQSAGQPASAATSPVDETNRAIQDLLSVWFGPRPWASEPDSPLTPDSVGEVMWKLRWAYEGRP
jgi:hypothetical protein